MEEEEMQRTQSSKGSSITNLNFPPMQVEFTPTQKGKPNEIKIIFKKNLCNFHKRRKLTQKRRSSHSYLKKGKCNLKRFMCILFGSPKV